MAQPRQRARQCADDVSKTTGLGERRSLGCHHQDAHLCLHTTITLERLSMIETVDPAARPPRPSRSDSREAIELRALKERQPDLADAINMHLELLEVQRRVQGRIPVPHIDVS